MNTRWHEEDVAGRVLQQIERGEISGRVISIPAIAEANDALGRDPGEYLWDEPEQYNYAAFLRARQRETSPMMWAALYQQRPAPEEGDYFKADWLKPYDTLPARETLRVYGASITLSRQMAAITRCTSLLGWIRMAAYTFWTSGAGNQPQTSGSKASVTS
jgi:hypothetical protein